MARKVLIMGDGAWGTALGMVLHANGHGVTIRGRSKAHIRSIQRSGVNRPYLKKVAIPAEIEWVTDVSGRFDFYVMAVPTQHIRSVVSQTRIPRGGIWVSASKGMEIGTLKRPSEILREHFGRIRVAVLSGPSHAEEVARGLPVAVTLACPDRALGENLQRLFSSERFRVYTSRDIKGVELGGALKNIIAIGAGIADGLGLGDNTKAALLTRGMVEITRLGVAMGGRRKTFYGNAGIGDLITTCISPHGRNLHVGREIGKGRSAEEVLSKMSKVAEGVPTCRAVVPLAREKGIEMPISQQVYHVLFRGKSPLKALQGLMRRRPKAEG